MSSSRGTLELLDTLKKHLKNRGRTRFPHLGVEHWVVQGFTYLTTMKPLTPVSTTRSEPLSSLDPIDFIDHVFWESGNIEISGAREPRLWVWSAKGWFIKRLLSLATQLPSY
jgi:hypothetical protein